tara:strand:- start:12 stop:530 length:519 start_codon:yes stop_codon:yes gene_type:complete
MKVTFFLVSLFFLFSCNESSLKKNNQVDKTLSSPREQIDNEKLSVDLIDNPNSALNNVNPKTLPIITFSNDVYDFGDINQGESITYDFHFTNSGSKDLIITTAKGSCGCTVPEWPKGPISPNEKGVIKVNFNSTGKSGLQNRVITILTNAIPNTKVLTIRGNVIVSKKNEKL